MREILFRGKRVDNGEWVKGDLIKCKDKCYIHPNANIFQVHNALSKLIVLHEVIPETVGQYTGLTDKNGTKIFEGDILIADFDYKKEPIEVIYYKCGFKLKSKHCKEVYDYSIHDETPELEVIGNKWDNPELLKGEEE